MSGPHGSSRRGFLRTGATGALAAWQLGRGLESAGNEPVPAPHDSTLCADTVADLVRTGWGLPVRGCDLYSNGVNHTYRVRTEQGRFWFRLTRRSHRRRQHVEGEIAMVRHLRAQGLPVVTVVPDREGRFVVPIRAPEGQRWGVLFEDVGVPWRPRLEAKRARAIGRIMADIHIAADALPEVPRMRIDFDAMFRRPPRVLAPFLADAPAVLEELEQLCEALAEHVRPLLPHDGGWGFCHGDLHLGNVFFDHDHRPFVIDFDHALHGYRAFDLAIHLCSLGPAAFYDAVGRSVRRTWWKNVFAGYDERIAPGPDFRPLVEALIPARMLVFACYMAQAVDTWGARILEPQRIRILLRITRLWAREARVPLPKALDEPTSASVLDAMIMRPSPFVLPPMGLRP